LPQGLHGFQDKATPLVCDLLPPWPTLKAVHLARRSSLERFFRAHHIRYTEVINQRIHAIKSATPLTTDEGVRLLSPWLPPSESGRGAILVLQPATCNHGPEMK